MPLRKPLLIKQLDVEELPVFRQGVKVRWLVNAERILVGWETLECGRKSPVNIHDGCDEIIYGLSGVLTVRIPGLSETHEIEGQDLFLVPSGMAHQLLNLHEVKCTFLFVTAPNIYTKPGAYQTVTTEGTKDIHELLPEEWLKRLKQHV